MMREEIPCLVMEFKQHVYNGRRNTVFSDRSLSAVFDDARINTIFGDWSLSTMFGDGRSTLPLGLGVEAMAEDTHV